MKPHERIASALERIAVALETQNGLLDREDACPHPADEREDLSTMGHPRWLCKVCGFSVGMEN